MLGNSYVVADGLSDGEEIVTQGAFSVDAAAQLEGKPSMMNQELSKNDTHIMTQGSGMNGATKLQVKVAGNCEMCKDRIETAAKSVSGVEFASWDIQTKTLDVNFDATKTNSEEIQKTIAKAGHDTEKFKAPDEVYSKLPECCLYRP